MAKINTKLVKNLVKFWSTFLRMYVLVFNKTFIRLNLIYNRFTITRNFSLEFDWFCNELSLFSSDGCQRKSTVNSMLRFVWAGLALNLTTSELEATWRMGIWSKSKKFFVVAYVAVYHWDGNWWPKWDFEIFKFFSFYVFSQLIWTHTILYESI